jgi:DNA-binding CsgD family transcriptional regulator
MCVLPRDPVHKPAPPRPVAPSDPISTRAFSQTVLDLYRASREVPFRHFQEHALTAIKALIPFDSAWWGVASAQTQQIHRLHLHHCDDGIVRDYPPFMEQDFFRAALIANPGRSINMADLVSRARYTRTPLYRGLGRKYRVEWSLGTLLIEPVSGLLEFITLWRHDARQPFTEDERQTKEWLMPHLAESYRFSRLVHLMGESRSTPRAWALLDERGYLREVSPAFVHLLREEWPGWQGDRLPDTFPSPARLRTGQVVAGRAIAVSASARGEFLLLIARRTSDIDRLGAREREVALRYARGETHAAIAAALGIAPATVRNHIARCYKHLAVNSKVELSRRLQAELA